MRKIASVILFIIVALLLSGCNTNTAGKGSDNQVDIEAPALAEHPRADVIEPSAVLPSADPTEPPRDDGLPPDMVMARVEGAELPAFSAGEVITTNMDEVCMYTGNLFWTDNYMFYASYDGNSLSLYMSGTVATAFIKESLKDSECPEWWDTIRSTFLEWGSEAIDLYTHYDEPISLTAILCDSYIRGQEASPFLTMVDGVIVYDVFQASLPDSPQEPSQTPSQEDSPNATPSENSTEVTTGMRNALSKANEYLSVMPFSHSGLVKQLEYEGFSNAEAVYGANNCGADWNEQAAKKAADYLSLMSFSRSGLIEQLEHDGFTRSQAEYGVSQNGY